MPLYAYNLEKAIDKFWQVKDVTNLPISTWFLLNGSMLTHGILIEWSNYLKKISKERYFRQAISTLTISNLYNALSIWKKDCFHMVFAIWIHAHTWNP
jgi:hypothetical protein